MEVKSTGISAQLTDRDVREAIVDFMDKHGYEINESDISFTMGRKPKALSCSIETGDSSENPSKPVEAVDTKESSQKDTTIAEVEQEKPQDVFDSTKTESSTEGSIFDTTTKEDPMMAAADPDLDTSSDSQQTASIFS